ncbi:MAG: hypothetical protein HUU35_19325, partial [Armatimonadetes bacterium]|nr:hypothetical protein [Armatimonadota bacterium]
MVARLEEQMRKPALGWALLLGVCLAPVGPVGAQLRWESYVHGGETFSLALHGEELWVGTSGGIRIFRGGAGAVQIRELTTRDNLPGNAVSALAFEPNALWIGTRAGVTGRLDLVANTWQTFDSRAGLPAAPVAELLFDGQEVYAATLGGGVARFNVLRQDWQVWNQEDGLPNATVRCLAADPEGLWAGTDRGLLRYTRDAMMWDPVRVDQGLTGRIDDLAISGGDLWIASASDGLCRIRLADGRFLRYELGRYGVKRVSALWPTAGGDLWVATDAGLVVATADAARDWSFVEHPLGETSGLVEQDGVVWVATRRDGIWRYRAADGNWDRYESHEALPSGELTALATQASATWVGFREHGVGRHDWNTGRWKTL